MFLLNTVLFQQPPPRNVLVFVLNLRKFLKNHTCLSLLLVNYLQCYQKISLDTSVSSFLMGCHVAHLWKADSIICFINFPATILHKICWHFFNFYHSYPSPVPPSPQPHPHPPPKKKNYRTKTNCLISSLMTWNFRS